MNSRLRRDNVVLAKAGTHAHPLTRWLAWIPAFAGTTILMLSTALALSVEEPLSSPAQEARAKALFQEIRCVVCQGESVADSPSQVASDMRRFVREQIISGESDEAIKATLTSRYGDHILMRPPFKPATLILWLGPLAVLALGALLARRLFRSSRT